MNLTTRSIPGAGRVEMCCLPSHNLEMYVEKLRDKYDVTIAEAPDFRAERHIYTLCSIDHEAEAAIDAQEAEFGADGTRVFRDPAAEQPQPTVAELFEGDKLTVGNALVLSGCTQDGVHAACSSLYFDAVWNDIEWRVEFSSIPFPAIEVPLL